ncbi:MAG TPA: hypothetical protein VI731_03375 [Bacteroidia bacterium]|nr:hypothetical protein [Bacteroidia bacterium]
MKKYFLIIPFLLLLIQGCKKDEPAAPITPPVNPPPVAALPLAIGNYWIYECVRIDTNGTETITYPEDSVYISKDSLINGETYYELRGMNWIPCLSCVEYVRDSAGFIVTCHGEKLFAPVYDNYLFSFDSISNYSGTYHYMTSGNTLVNVPAGMFITAVVTQVTYFHPNYNWDNPRYNNIYYCDGIGVVKEEQYYDASPDMNVGRLLRYHVE